MSRGNLRGGDPLQRLLELEEYRARLHREEMPREPEPEEPLAPIITQGLDYHKVPIEYDYPAGFGEGFSNRITMLNKALRQNYGLLGQWMNRHARAKAIFERNKSRPELKQQQLNQLEADVHVARSRANGLIRRIVRLLGEVDAVGGPDSYHVPDKLHKELDFCSLKFSVASGSLARLSEPANYVNEECPVSSDICMGDDTLHGRANQARKDHFEQLAYLVNRIQFLVESGCKDFFVKTIQEKLRREFDKVDLKAGEGYLIMPSYLHEAVVKTLTAAQKEKEEYKRRMAEALEKMKLEEQKMLRQQVMHEAQRKKDKEKRKKTIKQ